MTGQPFREVWDGMSWLDYRNLCTFWKDWPPAIVSLAVLSKLAPQLRGKSDPAGAAGYPDNGDAIAELTQLIGAPPPE